MDDLVLTTLISITIGRFCFENLDKLILVYFYPGIPVIAWNPDNSGLEKVNLNARQSQLRL